MGNVQGSTLTRTSGALDSYVSDLGPDIVYEKSLGSARFLKTVKCRHKNGYLVLKVFIKPDPGLTLRSYTRRLKSEKELLRDMPNLFPYQAFVETDKAGYLIRQWIASNLYDRISTRPFLTIIEKKWITFQLLNAMRDARSRNISHGDIKSENVLVTSWNWVYLSDFASYKPTYLPLNDPADFSFFFDTSGRRTCYIAPERFYTAETNPAISAKKSKMAREELSAKRDGKVTEAMDCFSLGCVIAELFLEGTPLFTLSQLFKFREGEYSTESSLSAIEDEDVRDMIKSMINIDPAARPSFDSLLHTSRGVVFPESFFLFFHNYVSSINELPPNSPFLSPTTSTMTATMVPSSAPNTLRTPSLNSNNPSTVTNAETIEDLLPSDSDHRVNRIWADHESLEPYLWTEPMDETVMNVKVDYFSSSSVSTPLQDVIPIELNIPNRESSLPSGGHNKSAQDGPALIILAILTANIRNCVLPSSKLHALDVLLALSSHLTDEAKLDRMVPYIVDLLHDDSPIVRAASLRTLTQILLLVTVITPSNFTIFPEYILPNIKHLLVDPDTSVRCMLAQCIVHLAETAVRYLEISQTIKAHSAFNPETHDSEGNHFEVSYDVAMLELQSIVQEHLSALLVDGSSTVKRAVLHHVSSLCIFLGKQKTNDVILSHMITYLNDRDWLLRYAFFESIVDVAACAGGRSLEEYIYPLMTQALCDTEESVVAKVLSALTSLCELGLFQKMRIWEILSQTLGFLFHPNVWIRQGAASLITVSTKQLPSSDVWCVVYPSLRHYLRSDVSVLNEMRLLSAMKLPLSRPVFEAAVQWAKSGEKTSFWKHQRRNSIKPSSPRQSLVSMKASSAPSRSKTQEDDARLEKLRQLGMSSSDESKLLAMRDYITKLAASLSSFASRLNVELEAERSLRSTNYVELPALGVVPQTVFLKSKVEAPHQVGGPLRFQASSPAKAGGFLDPHPRAHRSGSIAESSASGLEDLRRRLAHLNRSNSSVNLASPVHTSVSPLSATPMVFQPSNSQEEPHPMSPSESVVSVSTSSVQVSNRLHPGSTDGQKAAPAIGSSKANATGLLDTHSKMHSDDSPNPSGRSSPFLPYNLPPQTRNFSTTVPSISTYDGQEAGITTLLENMFLDDQRELQQDFGPPVHEGPVRRRNAVRHSFSSRDGTPRLTNAFLVAHLSSHSEAITCLALSPDHAFFVSGSDDQTVKIWDTARLERNVTSKPRHTYGQHHAKITALCMLEGVHCFASAGNDGSLHIVRVHVSQSASLPKYSKLQVIRNHKLSNQGEYITCMTHYMFDASSILVYATTHSCVTFIDVRVMQVHHTLQNPRQYGPITALCIDRKRAWCIFGTSMGVLSLWDIRFGLHLKSWYVGVATTGRNAFIQQISLHPTKGRGKWIIVAIAQIKNTQATPPSPSSPQPPPSAHNLLEVWDIDRSVLVETFVTCSPNEGALPVPQELTGVATTATPASAIGALVRTRQNADRTPFRSSPQSNTATGQDVRAFVVGADFGFHGSHRSELMGTVRPTRPFLISGSDDGKIRFWDMSRSEQSVVLSGLESELERPSFKSLSSPTATTYIELEPPRSNLANRAPQRLSLIAQSHQELLRNHQDIITALLCIDSPFRGGLVSGDRTGAIKVWRVDLSDG